MSQLIALPRVHSIFCPEPFRIPLAGKVDVCCFDKTGTLTTDHITLKGIAGVRCGTQAHLRTHRTHATPHSTAVGVLTTAATRLSRAH